MLTDAHKATRMGAALMFLERYERDGNTFLDQIVTGDETWISHNTPTSKRRSMEWHHAQSPKRPRKFKQTASARKLMASVFCDGQGVLLVDFMARNTTINVDAYCTTRQRLRQAMQNRRRGKLSHDIALIHDNARSHTARQTQTLLHDAFHCDTFDHPPYSPGLAPSDFYLFSKMKKHLAGKRFTDYEDLQHAVMDWLKFGHLDDYQYGGDYTRGSNANSETTTVYD